MFPFILCTLISLISCLNTLDISLTGHDWFLTNHQAYSTTAFVPGTIHTILFNAQLIPDPYSNFNDVDLRQLIYSSWSFSKNFTLDDSFLNGFDQFELHFKQIDTICEIRLNNCSIGNTKTMFVAYRFSVDRQCLSNLNRIQIDFTSPVQFAKQQALIYNVTVKPVCPPDIQHGECFSQFIRKEPCSFSWDWGPAFAPIGIPGDVFLKGQTKETLSIELESVNIAEYVIDENQWEIAVFLFNTKKTTVSLPLTFRLEKTEFEYQTNITIETYLTMNVLVPDRFIQLWWPNGYGAQNLYNFTIYHDKLLIGYRQIGFRTVKLIEHDYGSKIEGTSFYFLINYQPIYIKGSNWIPSDAFQERVTDEKLEILLRSAKLSNMNMLRVWGGGIYERNSFYDLADRLGIMLWHDFMFACSLYPVNEEFLQTVSDEVTYQVKRLQSHPSIVLWAGNNENEAAIAQNWYSISSDEIEKVKSDYRQLYVNTVHRTLHKIDRGANRPFITSSPSNGIESVQENYIAENPNNNLYGDVHFYGYTKDSWDPQTYPITRFLSETGIQSLPSLESWLEATKNQSDFNLESKFVQHREHSAAQIDSMISRIRQNLPTPVTDNLIKNFTEWIYLSQINQAMTLKSVSDFCRFYSSTSKINQTTSEGNTMGLMYWQINDIWQAPTWSTIEYNLKWKMAHYYVRDMYSPIYLLTRLTPYLASVTDEHAQLSLLIVNEYFEKRHGELICSIMTTNTFNVRKSLTYSVSLNASTTTGIFELGYQPLLHHTKCFNPDPCLVHCAYKDKEFDFNLEQTLFLARPNTYTLLDPEIHIDSVQKVTETQVQLILQAKQPALFVWIEVVDPITGYFSENGFHMLSSVKVVDFYSWSTSFVKVPCFRVKSLFNVTH